MAARAIEAGAVIGAVVGLAEAGWLAATSPLPEWWLFPYAVGLYGAIGAALGVGGAVVAFALARGRGAGPGRAQALGAIAAGGPLVLFIGRYLLNRDVFAEQGVPLPATLGLVAAIGVGAIAAWFVLPRLLGGPLAALARGGVGVGVWAALAAASGALALTHREVDPRDHFAGPAAAPALADKPNVIVIMVDTLRADHLGTYGGPVATPVIDGLAADGVVFEQAIAAASWTRAAGASILTGQLPCGHTASTKASRLPDDVVTWPEVLSGAGYTTGALMNNINLAASFGFDQGFRSFVYESPAYRFGATESVFGLSMYKVVHKVAERVAGGHKVVTGYYQPADVVLADASKFVAANRDGRWALFVHLMEPHDPYFRHPSIDGTGTDAYDGYGFARAEVEKPKLEQKDELHALYRGEVAFLDQQLAPFLAELKASGVYDDAVIVLTADHGEEFGEHGGFWHGTTLYDEQIHVPLIVKLPKGADRGARVPWQVRTIDLAPTLAGIAGAAPDTKWAGRDLRPDVRRWLDAQAAAAATVPVDPAADPAVAPPAPPDPATFARPAVSQEDFEGNRLESLRRDGFKYLRANAGNPRGLPEKQLFDVVADRGEQNDLLPTNAQVGGVYAADRATEADAEVETVLATCATGAATAGTVEMTGAECERLKSLGYLAKETECPK